MLHILLLSAAALAGIYFTFKYFSLISAIKKIVRDMDDIQQDLSQNQMLHLPIPDRHLKNLLCAMNSALEEIQKERRAYENREREFQKQIENISHDLRTPLTVILGYLKLFRKSRLSRPLCQEDLEETLEIVEQKAESMKQLVDAFYDYSRLNAGDYELSLKPVDISRMLRETLLGSYTLLEKADLKVDALIPEHPVWVMGEETALDRILSNLFQNAGRYADTWLQIDIREESEKIILTFSNDTRRLSPGDIPYLFERFYMQDKSRHQDGTGLGLTVSKALAEEMNGTLSVYIPKYPDACRAEALTVSFELVLPNPALTLPE